MKSHTTLLSLLALALGLGPPSLAVGSEEPASKRAQAAQWLGVPVESLIAGDVGPRAFPALGLTVIQVKGVDRATGRVTRLSVDEQGRAIDVAALEALELAIVSGDPTYKIEGALRERMEEAMPQAALPVAVWLRMDVSALDRFAAEQMGRLDLDRASREELREAEEEITAHAMARSAEVVTPFLDVLDSRGLTPRYVSQTAPVVFIDATSAQIADLAARPEVDSLLGEGPPKYLQNDDANATHRTDTVKVRGVKGDGIRVAVLEDGTIDFSCPDVDVAKYHTLIVIPTNHATAVAGCIASTQPGREGAAPSVELYNANAFTLFDADVVQAADWVASENIDITNLSFGDCSQSINFLDHFFNYESRTLRDSYASGAGNVSSCAQAWVGTPAKAYNVLATGNLRDQGDGDWANDDMNPGSCFVNPATGVTKPNFAANGTSVDTLGFGAPWQSTVSGNSISGPHMVGNLALAMQVDSTVVANPEAAMALMMATAWNNIEGNPLLSNVDGAGGIVGHAAYKCATEDRIEGGFFDANDFDANDQTVFNIHLEGDKPARVCFAWSAFTGGSIPPIVYVSGLLTDFDMTIFQGAGQTSGPVITSSSSLWNNFEIVQFTPPSTGTYSVRINGVGPLAGEPYGLAWSQECDIEFLSLIERVHDNLIDGVFPGTTKGRFFGLDLVNRGAPGAPYAVVPSATKGDGTPLASGKTLPVELDLWSLAWLALAGNPGTLWPGSIGFLDDDGVNIETMQIDFPCLPIFVGQQFHHAPVILDLDAVDNVKELGEVYSYTVLPEPESTDLPEGYISYPLPFDFPFFGNTYSSCYLNRNGTVTFGAPDTDLTESASELLTGPPRIAGLWDGHYFNVPDGPLGEPRVEVQTLAEGDDAQVVFTFLGTIDIEAGNVPSTTHRMVLLRDGEIELHFGLGGTKDGLVGIAPGLGQSSVGEIDLDESGHYVAAPGDAVYERFAGDGADNFDLGATEGENGRAYWNKLRFVPDANGGYELRLNLP